jgi:predicted nicotinamide N-methyase
MHSGPQRRNPEISVEVGPDAVLKLAQTRSKGSSTGWLVWPVAIDFCKFLLSHPELVRHKRVLELGAGTGAVGLTCGFIGSSSVSISDLEECLPILQSNLDLNSDLVNPSSKITIGEIRWGCDAQLDRVLQVHGTFDVIVGSDIIFHQPEAVLAALVNTISSASTPETKVLIAYEDRAGMVEDEEFFFGPMRSRFSSLEAIDLGGDRSLFIFSGFTC